MEDGESKSTCLQKSCFHQDRRTLSVVVIFIFVLFALALVLQKLALTFKGKSSTPLLPCDH